MACPVITLRPPRVQDIEDLFPLIYQTPVVNTLAWDGPDSLEDFRQGLLERIPQVARGQKHLFTIVETESQRPIGSADIRPDEERFRGDIGLWIGVPYQGRGYGTQVVRQLVVYGFEHLGMQKIEGLVIVGNWASRRIFEKNGFLLEGTIRHALRKYNALVDEWLLGLTREHYRARVAGNGKPAERLAHICERSAWQAALQRGVYQDPSLNREGFIHCSRPDQVVRTANHYYLGRTGLVVLWIDPAQVKARILWEDGGEGELFPHIYGPIPLEAVVFVQDLLPEPDGSFRES